MRILHVTHQYPPHDVGGVELYTQTLARFQADNGAQVAVFFPSPLEPQGTEETVELEFRQEYGVRVYGAKLGRRSRTRVFMDTFGQQRAMEALQEVLAREKPDLVHVQHLMGLPVAIVHQLRRHQRPLIITLWDYWFSCANAQLITNYDNAICDGPHYWVNCGRCALARAGLGNRPLLAPLSAPLLAVRGLLLRRVLAAANRLIAPLPFVRDTYARLGAPTERMIVVPPGIQVPRDVVRKGRARQNRRHPEEPLRVIYVGGIAWQKGLHVLIEAVNDLPPESIRLSIYGDLGQHAGYAVELQRLARHPGISFEGRLERSEFWRVLLEEVHVGVVPTLWYETASLVIQELFAARIPVLGSRIGVLPGRIRDGVDGLLFAPGDSAALRGALQRLLDEPDLLGHLSDNIERPRLMAEHVADIEAVYESVAP